MRPFFTSMTLYPVCLWWTVNIIGNKLYTWCYAKGLLPTKFRLTTVCLRSASKQYPWHIHLRKNIMDAATYMPVAMKQHTSVTSCWDRRTVLPTSLFSSLAFNLVKLQGQLVMQLSSTLKILLGGRVRRGGGIYAFQIQHKIWEYLRSRGLLRSKYW